MLTDIFLTQPKQNLTTTEMEDLRQNTSCQLWKYFIMRRDGVNNILNIIVNRH